MALDLLDTPIRISWHLSGDRPRLTADQAATVAGRLAEAGIFFALLDGSPLRHPGLNAVLAILAEAGCRTLAVCRGETGELDALGGDLPLGGLLLDLTPAVKGEVVDRRRLADALAAVRARGWEPEALFRPRAGNLGAVPDLLDFCRSHAIGKIKLPNTGVDDSFSAPDAGELPGPADLRRLEQVLAGVRNRVGQGGPVMEIHDLFLWELLDPQGQGERGEYGGCQAANSLGHVDAAGNLLPCSSWPVRLGSLLEGAIADFWASSARAAIRSEIDRMPVGCRECGDYPVCLGGCRGLARTFNRQRGCRDLYCTGPRR